MIIPKAVVVPPLILDLTMALPVGFVLGYGVREWISRRRRQAERRRQGLGGGFWRPRARTLRGKQPFHAPECYLNLLSAISCPDSEGSCAHASSSVDDSRAFGAVGACCLTRQAAARRPPGRKGRARGARPR